MQIQQELPQFEGKSALLIVTGAQAAKLFWAENGMVKELNSFEIENPQFSDNEGMMQSGMVHEVNKSEITGQFVKELERILKQDYEEKNAKEIYLFCPQQICNQVEERLPQSIRERVLENFHGNYTNEDPFELLKKVKVKQEEKKVTLTSEEAQKLLEK